MYKINWLTTKKEKKTTKEIYHFVGVEYCHTNDRVVDLWTKIK